MKTSNVKALIAILFVVSLALLINGQARAASMVGGMNKDEAIAMMVASKIAHDPLLQEMPIGVADYHGNITLSGAVHTQQQKERATEEARSVNGVKKINNLLEVVEPTMKQ